MPVKAHGIAVPYIFTGPRCSRREKKEAVVVVVAVVVMFVLGGCDTDGVGQEVLRWRRGLVAGCCRRRGCAGCLG